MAWVGYKGRVRIRDEHGLYSTKEVMIEVNDVTYASPAGQYGAAATKLIEYAEALDNVIDGVITDIGMSGDLLGEATGLKTTPGEQGVAEQALLSLWIDAEKTVPYPLPSAKEGIYLADFLTVDTGDAELLSFVGALTNNSADERITVSDGELVNATLGAGGLQKGKYQPVGRKTRV